MNPNNQPVSAPLSASTVKNTPKPWLGPVVTGVIVLLLTSAIFGGFIYKQNQNNQAKIDELNQKINRLESSDNSNEENSVTPTASSTTNPTTTPTRPANIPTDWVKFEDKQYFGISFYHPKDWSVEAKGGSNNTVGNTITVYIPNSSIDMGVGLQFLQISDTSDTDVCESPFCTIQNVTILGNKKTIDISGDTTNDKVLAVNPRLKDAGVGGYIQFQGMDPVVNTQAKVNDLKIMLESISYN